MHAVRAGRMGQAYDLLDAGAPAHSIFPDGSGCTPMHYAVRHGCEYLLELLIEAGAPPDVADADGRTPLHWAGELRCSDSALEIVRLLLDAGASASRPDGRGRTPLHAAAALVAGADSRAVIQALVDAGAQAGSPDVEGRTPLHLAVERWTMDRRNGVLAMQCLLDAGAPVGSVDRAGRTPLHVAASIGAPMRCMRCSVPGRTHALPTRTATPPCTWPLRPVWATARSGRTWSSHCWARAPRPTASTGRPHAAELGRMVREQRRPGRAEDSNRWGPEARLG